MKPAGIGLNQSIETAGHGPNETVTATLTQNHPNCDYDDDNTDELSADDECPHCGTDSLEADILTTVDEKGRHHSFFYTCNNCDFDSRYDDVKAHTKRAADEARDVSLLSKGGRYEVQSASGNRYEVDLIDESCTCRDWLQRSLEGGCKYLRRVDHEIKRARVPRPDGRVPSL